MDDLRDYRFYDDDMIHPSGAAINYVWNVFTRSYFDNDTMRVFNEAVKITKACNHRFSTDNISKKKIFAEKMLKQISDIEKKVSSINFSYERSYFNGLLNG
jgi:SPX domain protein involved in polyphosphate accumulation